MPRNLYKELPVETLQELLLFAVQELLDAMDKKDEVAIKAKKKQVEILCFDIFNKKGKDKYSFSS